MNIYTNLKRKLQEQIIKLIDRQILPRLEPEYRYWLFELATIHIGPSAADLNRFSDEPEPGAWWIRIDALQERVNTFEIEHATSARDALRQFLQIERPYEIFSDEGDEYDVYVVEIAPSIY